MKYIIRMLFFFLLFKTSLTKVINCNLLLISVLFKNQLVGWFGSHWVTLPALGCNAFRFTRIVEYFVHSTIVLWTTYNIRSLWHLFHIGCSSLLMKWECVRKMCPILIRMIGKYTSFSVERLITIFLLFFFLNIFEFVCCEYSVPIILPNR